MLDGSYTCNILCTKFMSCTFGVRSSTDGRTFATELSDVREANNQNDDDLRSAAAMRFGSSSVRRRS